MDDDTDRFRAVVRAGTAPGGECRRCANGVLGWGDDGACARCGGSGLEPPPVPPADVAAALGCERADLIEVLDVRRGRVDLIDGADYPCFAFRDSTLAAKYADTWADVEELSASDAARLRLGVRAEVITARVDGRGRRQRVTATRLLDD